MTLSSNLSILEASAHAIMDEAIAAHNPAKVFCLFSGGHDSLTTTHLVSRHPSFCGVIHINTGIGVPETNQFVRDTCAEHGWPLHELMPSATTGTYLTLVVRHGFPGPAQHTVMYRYLKERPLEKFISSAKERRGDLIMLCAGARSEESRRRMGTVRTIHRDQRRGLWVNPIHNWTAFDTTQYIAHYGLARNPVKDKLHISGECLCGCFADPTERREIREWFPHVDRTLSSYEAIVRAARASGLPEVAIDEAHTRWGWHRGIPDEQIELFPMCHYCHAARDETIASVYEAS